MALGLHTVDLSLAGQGPQIAALEPHIAVLEPQTAVLEPRTGTPCYSVQPLGMAEWGTYQG